ncbi:hypothetical protein AWC37_04350 [Staphylococcus xylosus]|uniref:DUF1381 domain-containing protein n=1 Tax=Staphylococcus xylosus TaxID=1288 RepID=UPI0009C10F93|nr:DUF1381 domain-containing protein [Staphylococcus xylosus]ARD74394.1 hypothetical protein AWC37_04350 [Staphylococcus xylosus]
MEYLVKKTEHHTGEVFADAKKVKENESYMIVEAKNSVELKAKLDMQQFGNKMKYYADKLNEVSKRMKKGG